MTNASQPEPRSKYEDPEYVRRLFIVFRVRQWVRLTWLAALCVASGSLMGRWECAVTILSARLTFCKWFDEGKGIKDFAATLEKFKERPRFSGMA